MNRAFVLLVPIVLAGCLPDRANDIAVCKTESDRFYQGYQALNVDDPRSRYIIGCMAAKGYDLDVVPADCDSKYPLVTQSACYTPDGRIARFIDNSASTKLQNLRDPRTERGAPGAEHEP